MVSASTEVIRSKIIRSNSMRFRKLRIAWSVFWGLACVLLIALWVRSYFHLDRLSQFSAGRYSGIESTYGSIACWQEDSSSNDRPWQFSTYKPMILAQFEYVHTKRGFVIRSPTLVPILVIGLLGGIPWIPSRFTLRTLLIATTLVAVVLGLIAWSIR
jgi:hypothetical protein